jgi:predicted  nucleic acid-binding Zn-ribbon protein
MAEKRLDTDWEIIDRYCNRCGEQYKAILARCPRCQCQEFSVEPNEQTRARKEREPCQAS